MARFGDVWKFFGRLVKLASTGKPAASIGAMPNVAVRQVEAEEVVAVADDLRDDLSESERHDREVVPAEAERRQADQDAGEERQEAPAMSRTSHIVMWMPGWSLGTDERKENVTWSNCCEANQPAV